MTSEADLTVGVFNIERFGFDPGLGNHRLPAALDFLLAHTPRPPDVLALPEANNGLADQQRAIRRTTVHHLSPHLAGGWYEPLFAAHGVPGRKNSLHLLLVNTAKVHPLGWADPAAPLDPGRRHYGWAQAEIFGHEINLCCEHWSGGEGREVFEQAANRISNQGGPHRKTIILGDFNADSGWDREQHLVDQLNWYQQCRDQGNLNKLQQKGWFDPDGIDPTTGQAGWEYPWDKSGRSGWWKIDTRQMDKLRSIFGYVDMGEEFGDPTPTTKPTIGSGLRIDRIMRSTGLPAEAIAYGVAQPPRRLSDHAYVFGTYRLSAIDSTEPMT
ncbi:endonuclease/exonuclease/phosphatase family protein [Actinocrispum wychmicini]|uniref:Endonuclease/exonuclease/phosphatase domain-containing protein n=1 Tax=Actinocrispum wychmicini TaxID=1213861 RepID=A0A4R2IHM1_9PSEU|nr:endonuclease/exonuclease/phosphatase family protein [Actinocrispum wychmicini]TCO43752.1 hypothetical protein EV192_12815 [Actinocrispum wychmicini]